MEIENRRSLEQVYRSAVSGLYARMRNNYDFLYEKFGEEGLKMISDMSREYGLEVAERARKGMKSNDISEVAKYLLRIFETVAYDKRYDQQVEQTKNRIVIKISECPMHFTDVKMCQAHTSMERTVVSTINPDLVYNIGKSIPAGDAICEHILELKK
jgi:hypothetical protein